MGSEDVFLKKRAKGTERADKASPNKGVEKFFGSMPTWDNFEGPTNVDLVIVPAIDGNYDGTTTEMGDFEAEFQTLLDWMDEAQLDRVGCFQYENVQGARANDLPDHVPGEVKQERWERFMEKAQAISTAKLTARVGQCVEVIVDDVDEDAAP